MKIRFAIFSFAVLLLLVASQIVWITKVAERDKSRFKDELTVLLNDIVKYQATKQIYELYEIDSESPSIIIEEVNSDSIPSEAKSYGSYDDLSYEKNTSLSKFIEAAMTEMLFEKNSISLQAVDTIFQINFPYTDELISYYFKMQKRNETIDSLFVDKSASPQLNDTTTGVFITIPLGTSGAYRFVSHLMFGPSTMTRRMMAPAWLSGVAVIAVAIILFVLLLSLKRQMNRLQLQEERTRGIVHDLKSPLSFLYSLLGFFEMGETDIQKNEQLTLGKSRIKLLSENIERMLMEAKLDEKKEKALLCENFDLEKHCLEIIADLRIIYSNKDIKAIFEIEPDARVIEMDAFYFDSCLHNLLDNAIKYSDAAPNIKVVAKRDKKKVSIAIKDNGIGIAKEEQRKVFNQFYRSKRDSNVKGDGIGLSFVKQVVDSHGGTIYLNSNRGEGSTFTIHLPYKNN